MFNQATHNLEEVKHTLLHNTFTNEKHKLLVISIQIRIQHSTTDIHLNLSQNVPLPQFPTKSILKFAADITYITKRLEV